MARIEYAPEVFDDFDRFFDHVASTSPADAPERIAGLLEAVEILARNPLIGRPFRDGKRELVIGRGSGGYVALYRYVPDLDTVFVLAFRSQGRPDSGTRAKAQGRLATLFGRCAAKDRTFNCGRPVPFGYWITSSACASTD